jgi:hypothetical protein
MKNPVFLDVTACSSCRNRRFVGTYRLHHHRGVLRLLVTANVVPSSPNLFILMREAIRSSETSVLTRVTRRNSPEDGIPQLEVSSQRSQKKLTLSQRKAT